MNATLEARPEAGQILLAGQVIIGLLTSLLACVLLLQGWSLYETLTTKPKAGAKEKAWYRNPQTELQLLLTFQLFTICAIFAPTIVGLFVTPFPSHLNCDVNAKMFVVGYALSVQSTYLFLVAKSSLVSGFEKGVWFKRVSSLTKWGLIIFVPLVALPFGVWLDVGVVTREGVCVDLLVVLWFPVLFIIGNAGLSIALIWLFVYPLSTIMRSSEAGMSNRRFVDQVKKIVHRNIFYGVIMIVFSTLNVVADTTIWTLMNSNIVEYDYLGILVYVFAGIDMICLLLCPRLMTNLWLPTRLRKYARMGAVTSEQVSTPVVNSKNSAKQVLPGSGSPVATIRSADSHQIKSLDSSEMT